MLGLLGIAILLAVHRGTLGRQESIVLFLGYPAFLIVASTWRCESGAEALDSTARNPDVPPPGGVRLRPNPDTR